MAIAIKLGLLFLAAIFSSAKAATDATLEELSAGKEVTEAVIRKITSSKIFPEDNSFLIRLAYTETRFGENTNTFRTDYLGGIWAVEESVFQITKSPKLYPRHTSINLKFNINWTNTEWEDLLKPMHSGLAAALYFEAVLIEAGEAIPQTVTGQAAHWKKFYRPLGIAKTFEDDAEELKNQTRCRGKMDLCIVLDSSGSIDLGKPGSYQKAKDFVASMIESFSLDFTRLGMLVYSDDPLVIFRVNNTNTTTQLANLARGARYLNSGTRTDKGIAEAIGLLNEAIFVEGVPRIMTVFTDGESDRGSNLTGAIGEIQRNNIKSVSIGIGSRINHQELLAIALNDTESVFELSDFDALESFLQRITSVACETPQSPLLNSTYEDSLIQDEKRIYKIEPPPEGITVIVNTTIGTTKGYWSHSAEVPSIAFNDGVIDGATFIPAPPGISGTKQSGGEDEEPLTNIYVTIQGVDDKNNYTLTMTDGDRSGASLISVTNWAIIIMTVLHIGLN